MERIYRQIDLADIIIADMSGQNSNVFYEVGYAHAKGKLCIHLTSNADYIPFDLKHRRHIVYRGSINTLKDKLIEELNKDVYDVIIINYANPDMVGHTGNYDASIIAVETVDREVGRILAKAKDEDYSVVLTSDHGNCEEMRCEAGKVLTNHTTGSVWCFVQAEGVTEVKDGGLNNIAPTVLKLMELEIPSEMDTPLI